MAELSRQEKVQRVVDEMGKGFGPFGKVVGEIYRPLFYAMVFLENDLAPAIGKRVSPVIEKAIDPSFWESLTKKHQELIVRGGAITKQRMNLVLLGMYVRGNSREGVDSAINMIKRDISSSTETIMIEQLYGKEKVMEFRRIFLSGLTHTIVTMSIKEKDKNHAIEFRGLAWNLFSKGIDEVMVPLGEKKLNGEWKFNVGKLVNTPTPDLQAIDTQLQKFVNNDPAIFIKE